MTDRELLQQALDALISVWNSDRTKRQVETILAIKARLAQPEPEPVACVQDLDEVKRKHLVYEKAMDWKDPLYTTPPQRTWIGLTDEDKQTAFDETQEGGGFWEFADAIEAKLKEKNT